MKNPIRIELAFDDWTKDGVSIYQTEAGVELSMNDFHTGTVFYGLIFLDGEHSEALTEAIEQGFTPTFRIFKAEV